MRRAILFLVFAAASVGRGEPAPFVDHPAKVPDPSYRPKRGDKAQLCFYTKDDDSITRWACATESTWYREYWKSLRVGDDDGIRELFKDGRLILPDIGTEVLVLEVEQFERDDDRATCAVVRILEGPHKGKKVWASTIGVNRMVPNPSLDGGPAPAEVPTPAESLRAAKFKEKAGRVEDAILAYRVLAKLHPGTPEASEADGRVKALEAETAATNRAIQAQAMFVIATNLEKSGKSASALGWYRRIVKEFPKTPAAVPAAEKVKSLGGKSLNPGYP